MGVAEMELKGPCGTATPSAARMGALGRAQEGVQGILNQSVNLF